VREPCHCDGFRFTGKERDVETNNDFFQARYLSAFQMRFTSADPLGNFVANASDPQSWNMYAYARNNPLLFTDPSGYDYCDLGGGDTSYDPSVGGLTQDECAYENGTWVVPTVNDTVTGGQNEGEMTSNLDDWLNQWSAENGPPGSAFLETGFTFSVTGTSTPLGPGYRNAPQTPWYKTCTARAIGNGLLHVGIDAIGLIPEGSVVARPLGNYFKYRGIVADQFGAKAIRAVKVGAGVGSTGVGADDVGTDGSLSTMVADAQALAGAGGIVATFAGAVPVVGQVFSGLSIAGDFASMGLGIAKCN
jgi:RHS repeat-associated protein